MKHFLIFKNIFICIPFSELDFSIYFIMTFFTSDKRSVYRKARIGRLFQKLPVPPGLTDISFVIGLRDFAVVDCLIFFFCFCTWNNFNLLSKYTIYSFLFP